MGALEHITTKHFGNWIYVYKSCMVPYSGSVFRQHYVSA